MVKQNTVDGRMQKRKFYVNQFWISGAFELREPEFYKLVTTVTRGDEIRTFYTIPIGQCNQLTIFEE